MEKSEKWTKKWLYTTVSVIMVIGVILASIAQNWAAFFYALTSLALIYCTYVSAKQVDSDLELIERKDAEIQRLRDELHREFESGIDKTAQIVRLQAKLSESAEHTE